jgi:hypothetical protein
VTAASASSCAIASVVTQASWLKPRSALRASAAACCRPPSGSAPSPSPLSLSLSLSLSFSAPLYLSLSLLVHTISGKDRRWCHAGRSEQPALRVFCGFITRRHRRACTHRDRRRRRTAHCAGAFCFLVCTRVCCDVFKNRAHRSIWPHLRLSSLNTGRVLPRGHAGPG